jgi:hypothetical protein
MTLIRFGKSSTTGSNKDEERKENHAEYGCFCSQKGEDVPGPHRAVKKIRFYRPHFQKECQNHACED